MKIAQIISTFPPYKGGMGNVALNYARLLAERGHSITTFTPLRGKLNTLESDGLSGYKKVARLKPVLKYGNAAFLPRIFFKLRNFDAVILHYPFFGTAEVVWLARIFGMFKGKLIFQYHMDVSGLSPFAGMMSLPSKFILPGLIRRSDAVLTASLDYVKNSDIKSSYARRREKFIELPFGVDLKRFYPAAAEAENAKTESAGKAKTILFVAGLDRAHYFKGLDTLLDAMSELRITLPTGRQANYELQIVGSGDLKAHYEKMAENLGIADKTKFLGSVSSDELPKLYRSADIFVLPSVAKGEAFGLVLLEAMASGTPVIASNLPGVRSVFQDGIQGYLARAGDAKDLAEKMEKILADDELRRKMGRAGRKLVEMKYDWEKTGDELEKAIKA
ncbi:MAG: glycosyltransferase family 4 protein [Patescibacteria group bacterium]|jgi:glycosyltransferase involved in cell wall biosynthesis